MLRFLALNTGARRDFVPFRQPPPPHPLFSLRSQTATSQLAGFRNNIVPIIKPHKSAEYDFQQSKYDVAPRIPFSQIVVGPSGSGKSILLQNMILDFYRNCFQRVFIFSASIHVDSVWHPVKEYIEKTLKVNPKKEKNILMSSTKKI